MTKQDMIEETINTYFKSIEEKNKTTWLNLFAKDGISYDPVNSPPLDTEEKRGAFFDGIINYIDRVNIELDKTFIVDKQAAIKWRMEATGKNSQVVTFEGIDIFEINQEGKVTNLWTYWDPSGMGAFMN